MEGKSERRKRNEIDTKVEHFCALNFRYGKSFHYYIKLVILAQVHKSAEKKLIFIKSIR